MKTLQVIVPTLILATLFLNVQSIDYSPCTYGRSSRYKHVVSCRDTVASELLDVFHRNKNNSKVDALYLWRMDDITDDILGEILETVASSASHDVLEINLRFLPQVEKVPEALQLFNNIHWFNFNYMDGLKLLPTGSMVFSSNFVNEVNCCNNPNLEMIEPGAFQGTSVGIFVLRENNLQKFDEAVFKPLLADSGASIILQGNPIACDCGLAWILRDNRQYLDNVIGDCYDVNGQVIDIGSVDPTLLKDC